MKTDVFICHASEDKDEVVRPLAGELLRRGLTVWYDEFALKLGDGLARSIDEGLSLCRFGVVVLSHTFFSKRWPGRELDGLVAREVAEDRKVILPVWHQLTATEVVRYSPTLAAMVAVSTAEGLPIVAERIVSALVPGLEPALFAATKSGDVQTVQQLLSKGVNPDARGPAEETPLHVASMRGHVKVAEVLLRCRADVNADDRDRWTPLHVAATAGHLDVVRLLISYGADVNADRHVTGMRPYDMAMMREVSAAIKAAGGSSRWPDGFPPSFPIGRFLPPEPEE